MNTTKNTGMSGFTLVELSIVLVIIGLIVGGVLLGQDLIKSAEIRATVAQKEKFDTATNTFRGKYNGIPGDLTNPTTFFTFTATAPTGANGHADGDGMVEDASAAATPCTGEICLAGEAMIYWSELAKASLISEPITADAAATYTPTPSDANLPPAKIGKGGRFAIGNRSGINYFILGNPGSTASAGSADVTWSAGLNPVEAFGVDNKMDDGKPQSGGVLAVTIAAPIPGTAETAGATACGLSTNLYNTVPTYASSTLCNLGMRTSF